MQTHENICLLTCIMMRPVLQTIFLFRKHRLFVNYLCNFSEWKILKHKKSESEAILQRNGHLKNRHLERREIAIFLTLPIVYPEIWLLIELFFSKETKDEKLLFHNNFLRGWIFFVFSIILDPLLSFIIPNGSKENIAKNLLFNEKRVHIAYTDVYVGLIYQNFSFCLQWSVSFIVI